MKPLLRIDCLAAVTALTFCTGLRTACAADLLIEVRNIPAAGNVRVALYDGAASFLRKPVAVASGPASAGMAKLKIERLASGSYAASAFLDRNDNQKLDTNSMGIPIEPYGMSRDAKGKAAPPSFEEASFRVGGEDTRITIALRK